MKINMESGVRVIKVYDESRREWRSFQVDPTDKNFQIRCGNGIHQIAPDRNKCVCKKFQREGN